MLRDATALLDKRVHEYRFTYLLRFRNLYKFNDNTYPALKKLMCKIQEAQAASSIHFALREHRLGFSSGESWSHNIVLISRGACGSEGCIIIEDLELYQRGW